MTLGSAAGCREGSELGQDVQGDACPAPSRRQVQHRLSGADGEATGGCEQAQAKPFWFPVAGLVAGLIGGVGAAQELQPGGEVRSKGEDLAPDLVRGEPVQRRLVRPVFLALRMRSSQGARRRWRSSRSAS